jgi:hypothetical protein
MQEITSQLRYVPVSVWAKEQKPPISRSEAYRRVQAREVESIRFGSKQILVVQKPEEPMK